MERWRGEAGGGLQTGGDSCRIQIAITGLKPDTALNHISKLRENKMDTFRKHTETGFTCEGEIKYCHKIWAVAI